MVMTTHTIGTRGVGPGGVWPAPSTFGAADWLCLAAAPTFAVMALVAGVRGSHDLLCAATQDASPLSGMVFMYLLMSAFHSAPWLKLITSWRSRRHLERVSLVRPRSQGRN